MAMNGNFGVMGVERFVARGKTPSFICPDTGINLVGAEAELLGCRKVKISRPLPLSTQNYKMRHAKFYLVLPILVAHGSVWQGPECMHFKLNADARSI